VERKTTTNKKYVIYNKYELTIDPIRKEYEENRIIVDPTVKVNYECIIKNIIHILALKSIKNEKIILSIFSRNVLYEL
jgi:hypothetical protein